jgi:hypothetical protein
MTPEQAFDAWAPPTSPWSPWTKPVLFSYLPAQLTKSALALSEPEQTIPLLEDSALLVEVPGPHGIQAGLSLARQGYRPIPLYNATPAPFPGVDNPPALAVIDVKRILDALEAATIPLSQLPLPASAPPAFLLDASRHDASFSPDASWFDNRSIIRPSDVPSGEFLKSHGISRIVLLQASPRLHDDLRVVLLDWQRAGLHIASQSWGAPWQPRPAPIAPPNLLQMLWTNLRLRLQFPPNSSGAFGRFTGGSSS